MVHLRAVRIYYFENELGVGIDRERGTFSDVQPSVAYQLAVGQESLISWQRT